MESQQKLAPHDDIQLLPYSESVGQNDLKLALELSYIAPRIGGILISGHRGTGKSTIVRAFAQMVNGGRLPVTLPINATEDRVIGGWRIDELMRGEPVKQPGLLEEADGGFLYVDEINLLDDHIVNIILDVLSSGVLTVQREGRDDAPKKVSFSLIGTMNPEEGLLRPQLLDRFGLMVNVSTASTPEERLRILETVLRFDAYLQDRNGEAGSSIEESYRQDAKIKALLDEAKDRLHQVEVGPQRLKQCVDLAQAFDVVGHRPDFVMALAARALAAREGDEAASAEHLRRVAPLVLNHRRISQDVWSSEDENRLGEVLNAHLSA